MSATPTDTPMRTGRLTLAADPILLLVALLAVVLPLVPVDINSARWHGAKTLVFEIGAALLLVLLSVFGRAAFRADKPRLGPPLALSLLVFWGLLSYILSPTKGFAIHGLWLLTGGAVVALAVASATRARERLQFLLDAFNAAALVVSVSAFALYLQAGMKVAEGTYHDHMLLGAALMILLPMTLAASVSPVSQARRTVAMIALVLCAAALLLAQTRSSWIGAAIALLVFGTLFVWCRRRAPKQRETHGERQDRRIQAITYVALVVVALGGFLVYAQQNGLFADRAKTLTTSVIQGKEASVEWRFSTWRGALKMIEEKPFLGWGVGCYPLHQQPFTGTGELPSVVAQNGPRIWDEAHNSYLQIAAELGVPGLILWLLVLGTAFLNGTGALRRLNEGGLRQRALIGGLAALTGQAVDALANPGWQFGEIAIYLWIILGLVVGLTSEARSGAEGNEARAEGGNPNWMRPVRIIAALLVCIFVIFEAVMNARLLPTPHL